MKKAIAFLLFATTAAFAAPYFQVLQLQPGGQSSATIATVPVPSNVATILTNYPTATSIEFIDSRKNLDKIIWTVPATNSATTNSP